MRRQSGQNLSIQRQLVPFPPSWVSLMVKGISSARGILEMNGLEVEAKEGGKDGILVLYPFIRTFRIRLFLLWQCAPYIEANVFHVQWRS